MLVVNIHVLYALKIKTFSFRIIFSLENKFLTCFVCLLILLCFYSGVFCRGILEIIHFRLECDLNLQSEDNHILQMKKNTWVKLHVQNHRGAELIFLLKCGAQILQAY